MTREGSAGYVARAVRGPGGGERIHLACPGVRWACAHQHTNKHTHTRTNAQLAATPAVRSEKNKLGQPNSTCCI